MELREKSKKNTQKGDGVMNRTREAKADGVIIIEKQKTGDRKMKTANKWMMTAVVTAMIFTADSSRAGDLTPPGAPGKTMHSLEDIYQELLVTQQQVNDLKLRMGMDGMAETIGGMVLLPEGSFQMGDIFAEGDTDELPVHTVTVSAFYMDQYKVTKRLWDEVYTYAAG
jgi:formylglycine-generating enzyme required for sulfatase activity